MSFDAAMKLTIPQIIMLNHGAAVNRERGEERYEWKKEQEELAKQNPVLFAGKRANELSTEEFMAYWHSGF